MKYVDQCCMWVGSVHSKPFLRYIERLKNIVSLFMEKAATFSILDFAILKLCLLSFGLWLGSSFTKFFKKLRVFLFISFLVSCVFFVWRIFGPDRED